MMWPWQPPPAVNEHQLGDDGLFEKPRWPWQQPAPPPMAPTSETQGSLTPLSLSPCPSDGELTPLHSACSSPRTSLPPRACSDASGSEDAPTVHEWLEGIKTGYGAKFVPAFEQLGIEDTVDAAQVDKRVFGELETALVRGCGAKPMHVKKDELEMKAPVVTPLGT